MPTPFFNDIPPASLQRCQQIINNAINAWRDLVVLYAAENVAKGITQQEKTKLIADTLKNVMIYGQTGSLWQAYEELSNIQITPDMAPYITEARVEWMKNQLIDIISTL